MKKSKKIKSNQDFIDLTTFPLIDNPDFEKLYGLNQFGKYQKQAKDMNELGYCKLQFFEDKEFIQNLDILKSKLENLNIFKNNSGNYRRVW